MMDEIKVGDRVIVYRPAPCCGGTKSLGLIYTVTGVVEADCICTICGRSFIGTLAMIDAFGGFELSRIKKLPELKTKQEKKEAVPA
jgi:hypothetical protein